MYYNLWMGVGGGDGKILRAECFNDQCDIGDAHRCILGTSIHELYRHSPGDACTVTSREPAREQLAHISLTIQEI